MLILTLLVNLLATLGTFVLIRLTAQIKKVIHQDAQIDVRIKFQSAQLALGLAVLGVVYLLNPKNFARFFRIGDLSAPASGITWLDIPAGMSWLEIATILGLSITLVTTIYMAFQLKKVNASFSHLPTYLPWVILFSAVNAFVEESIFRIGIVSPLYRQISTPVILLISGIMFGIPHYFGMPKGVLGVIMTGFLGWLLAMSVVETQGIFLAWVVHFIQDVVIFGSLILIGQTKSIRLIDNHSEVINHSNSDTK